MNYLHLAICGLAMMVALSALEAFPIVKILTFFGLIVLATPSAYAVLNDISRSAKDCVPEADDVARAVAE